MSRRRYRKNKVSAYILIFLFVIGFINAYPEFTFWLIVIGIVIYSIKYFRQKSFLSPRLQTTSNDSLDISEEESLHSPYIKKKSHVTEAEFNFNKILHQIVGERYDIQRQVLLSSIVDTASPNFYSGYRNYNPDRSRIDRKTIDFVLFNKEDLSAYIAIELDDTSHNRPDRYMRDAFVEKVLRETKIPLVRIKTDYSYNPEEIAKLLNI